jgi:hypothetical protein
MKKVTSKDGTAIAFGQWGMDRRSFSWVAHSNTVHWTQTSQSSPRYLS